MRPFERATSMATILAHVNEAPMPPSSASELPIPPAVDALVLECLAKDPARRPGTAAELSSRLAAAVDRDAWGQTQARKWWETHRPARAPLAPACRSPGSRWRLCPRDRSPQTAVPQSVARP